MKALCSTVAILATLSAVASAGPVLESELDGTAVNNTTGTAQAIAPGAFTNDLSPNIFQGSSIGLPGITQTATVIGHVGNQGTTSDIDFFSFALPIATTAWFDIDNGDPGQDTILAIFDAAGTLIAWADDTFFIDGGGFGFNPDPGSSSTLDSFLGEISLAAGTYFAAVSEFPNFPTERSSPGFTSQPSSFGGGSSFDLWFTEPGASIGVSSYFHGSAVQVATTSNYQLHISYQSPTPIPEPASIVLLGLGVGVLMRRRKRAGV